MSQNQGYGVFEDDRPSKTPFIVLAVLALLVVVGLAGFVYAVGGPGAQERSMAGGIFRSGFICERRGPDEHGRHADDRSS